jgi:hypothetical protein
MTDIALIKPSAEQKYRLANQSITTTKEALKFSALTIQPNTATSKPTTTSTPR